MIYIYLFIYLLFIYLFIFIFLNFVKTFFKKGLGKCFGHFWFLNHSLRWFIVVPPKDGFAPSLQPNAPIMKTKINNQVGMNWFLFILVPTTKCLV